MAQTIRGSTTALRALNQRRPGIARMVLASLGISSTVVVTAMPMAMARAAAMTIWVAEPATRTEFHHGFLVSCSVVVCWSGDMVVDVRRTFSPMPAVFSVVFSSYVGGEEVDEVRRTSLSRLVLWGVGAAIGRVCAVSRRFRAGFRPASRREAAKKLRPRA